MLAEPREEEPSLAEPQVAYTDHALLVVWGQFAHQIGLVAGLMGVPVAQKAVVHAPQAKLIELLVATLAGCAYLQDVAVGPHPLIHDRAVAEAWGQAGWADPSGVSRTCAAADEQTIGATLAVLQQVSQPFIDREVLLAIRREGVLTYDADLTGREVAPTSGDYPGAAYGWMGDHVGLGYQAAVVSLRSPSYGRLLLTAKRHAGDTVAGACLEEMVRAAETATGARPRRRPELVAERRSALVAQREASRQHVEQAAGRVQAAQTALAQATTELTARTAAVQALATGPEGDPAATSGPAKERPYGRLAKARARQAVLLRRIERRRRDLTRAEGVLERRRQALRAVETEEATLAAREAALVAENATNPAPLRAIFRVDAGFGDGPNVAWLIEMGYEVYTKAQNAQVTARLRATEPSDGAWERVGKNAQMRVQSGIRIGSCPYPLDVALERFQTGATLRHATLLHYGDEPVATDPSGWFHRYNARQTLEAGIKENKGVFQMRHLKLRSAGGLALAEAFALFAANLVRWAAVWLAEQERAVPAPFAPGERPLRVKELVRTAANTSAWISGQPSRGVVVTFTERSPFAGLELTVGISRGIQLPLPLLKCVQISPP